MNSSVESPEPGEVRRRCLGDLRDEAQTVLRPLIPCPPHLFRGSASSPVRLPADGDRISSIPAKSEQQHHDCDPESRLPPPLSGWAAQTRHPSLLPFGANSTTLVE